jgi:hypothetical protein
MLLKFANALPFAPLFIPLVLEIKQFNTLFRSLNGIGVLEIYATLLSETFCLGKGGDPSNFVKHSVLNLC